MSRYFDATGARRGPIENPSDAPSLADVDQRRRRLLRDAGRAAAGAATAGSLAGALGGCAGPGTAPGAGGATVGADGRPLLGFRSVPQARDDTVHVPDGYTANVLIAWGDPLGDPRGLPAFRFDASNSADDQALQSGTHHDGMFFFPLPAVTMEGVGPRPPAAASSEHGLLVTNHEYPDHGKLFRDGAADWSLTKARKSQAALGVSIIEVRRTGPRWAVSRPSTSARRIHGNTPIRISGPAAGADAMKTPRSTTGRQAYGTFANCANGWTPWGTYLSCEENFHLFFKGRAEPTRDEARYGISARNNLMRWGDVDPRFDVTRSPNEPNHFGWVVEIDPYDPKSVPVKRTALGRKKHESAASAVARDGRVAFYMGDDQPFEYLYKFVTARPWNRDDRAANRDLLDDGVLHVARFDADGNGQWLALVHGRNGLTAENGFASQADVLIRARAAADRLGATPLDRPEWTAVDPASGSVYCALTHNPARGSPGRPGADAANPRAQNRYGHTLRIDEAGGDAAASAFRWEIFALAGDPNAADATQRGNVRGDVYASPDGMMVDLRGVVWVQTDVPAVWLLRGDHAIYGNNQMLAIDPRTRETRRFLTGPRGCEVTGACLTPDATTMFVNIQHPGEGDGRDGDPRTISNWPDQRADGRPRSATVVIRKLDGGVIGT